MSARTKLNGRVTISILRVSELRICFRFRSNGRQGLIRFRAGSCASQQRFFVSVVNRTEDRIPGWGLLCMFPCRGTHLRQPAWIFAKFVYTLDELRIILGDEPAYFVFHNEFGSAIGSHDSGNTSSQRLKDDIAKRIGVRGKDECIEIGICLRELFST